MVSLVCSINPSVLSPITHCLVYYRFIVSLEVRYCQSPNFLFIITLALLGLLPFDENFRISLSISTTQFIRILIGIALNGIDQIGKN